MWWIRSFGYWESENTCYAGSDENVFSPHLISWNSPDAAKQNECCSRLECKDHWRVWWSSTRIHMCYLCFCIILTTMFPKIKFPLYFKFIVNKAHQNLNLMVWDSNRVRPKPQKINKLKCIFAFRIPLYLMLLWSYDLTLIVWCYLPSFKMTSNLFLNEIISDIQNKIDLILHRLAVTN